MKEKEIENHLVVGNTDRDLAAFSGNASASPEDSPRIDELPEDTRHLCEREQMCADCKRCEK